MSINMPIPTTVGQQFTASNDVTYVALQLSPKPVWISIGSTNTKSGSNVSVGDNPPQSPGDGDLWFNTVNGILYVYYESETVWVDARPSLSDD